MIQFEPLISWTWAWLFASAMIIILGFQLLWILKSELKVYRKASRMTLNMLFSIVLIGYVFQPVWTSSQADEPILIYSSDNTKDEIRFWKDSLNIKKSVNFTKYQGEGNPVYLLGSDYSRAQLMQFGNKDVKWISNIESGSITFLEWKGILRQGENQRLSGKIAAKDSLKISLSQQGEILAKAVLLPDSSIFKLEFPARVLGRNELELKVNDSLYGFVNFFAAVPKPIQYRLNFAFPDPEIRFLSQHLINSGESVNEEIDISKTATIRSGTAKSDSLQFLIIDPSQLTKKATQDALQSGASILIINLNEVGKDIPAINRALATNFKAKRITTEERREIAPDLEAEPFKFDEVIAQKLFFENGFAVQQIGNTKVGVSLLAKTFPIKLAGDSVRYQGIWQKILGAMMPQESGAVQITQPVFKGLKAEIQVNQADFLDDFIAIESDSVFLQASLMNPFSRSGRFVSIDSGWVEMGDSLEFYSYEEAEWASLRESKLRSDFLTEYSKKVPNSQGLESISKISDWVWLGLFLLLLTMIWVEPKVFT